MSVSVEDLIERMRWMAARDLAEFSCTTAGATLRLVRAASEAPLPPAPFPDPLSEPEPAPAAPAGRLITAALAGLCHLAPEPGARPFVAVGDRIEPGRTVCIIEAMKVMTQMPADGAGRIAEILVADGSPVEAGTPILRLED